MTSALVIAVLDNRRAAARLLLDRGANPNLAGSDGATPLMAAAMVGSLPLLQLLLEAKAEVNATTPKGFTAFHAACLYNQPDCAEALVRAGCDTSLRTTDGMTGRDCAQEKGHTAVLERLRSLVAEQIAQRVVPTAQTTEIKDPRLCALDSPYSPWVQI